MISIRELKQEQEKGGANKERQVDPAKGEAGNAHIPTECRKMVYFCRVERKKVSGTLFSLTGRLSVP